MDIAMILIVSTFWLTSTVYVMRWHYKNGETAFGVVLVALLLGPILVFLIRDESNEVKKRKQWEEVERLREEEHIRWLGSQRLPPFRHIPSPNRRPNKITKDFKFFH